MNELEFMAPSNFDSIIKDYKSLEGKIQKVEGKRGLWVITTDNPNDIYSVGFLVSECTRS